MQVSLHAVFYSFKLSCVILIIVPFISKCVYCLTMLEAYNSSTFHCSQTYGLSYGLWFILKFVWSLPQENESASVMLLQTWHCLILHLYKPTIISKGYSLALIKLQFNLLEPLNETIGCGVNIFFTSLSMYKILRFLSIVALKTSAKDDIYD